MDYAGNGTAGHVPLVNIPSFSYMGYNTGVVMGVSLLVVLSYRLYSTSGRRPANYPPGPPTVPILGNMLEFPSDYLQYKFSEGAKTYGDAVSFKIMNQTIIALNTPSLVKELLDVRSSSSSNRPKSTLTEIMTADLNMGTNFHADDTWKVMRKASQLILGSKNLKTLEHVQHAEATQMVMDLITDPEPWTDHAKRYVTSFLLSVVYGFRAVRTESPAVRDLVDVHRRFVDILNFGGAPPVDLFPILKWVPRCLAGWKADAEDIGRCQQALFARWTGQVRARLDRGQATGCVMEDVIPDMEKWGMKNVDWLNNLGGTLLEASDTVPVTIWSFIICAVLYPEKQAVAAAELARVVGPDRVPRHEDLGSLPYTRAFISESMRMYPVAPVGIPHEMSQDEVIDGVLYPKGATVFQNTWFMFRDERYFDQPHEFTPERFLHSTFGTRPGVVDDPARRDTLLWGSGRRICPGQLAAKTSIEVICPYLLWAFDFARAVDPVTGRESQPALKFEHGIVAVPDKIPCRIVPKSQRHVETVRREFGRVAEVLQRYELEVSAEDAAYNEKFRDIYVGVQ